MIYLRGMKMDPDLMALRERTAQRLIEARGKTQWLLKGYNPTPRKVGGSK